MPEKKLLLQFAIWLLFTANLFSQSLYLSAIGDNENETAVIDSLLYRKTFNDYQSLLQEVDTLKARLNTIGYVESELKSFNKSNDSTYTAQFSLNNKYDYIHIYYKDVIDKKLLSLISNSVTDDYFEVNISNLEASLNILNTEISNQGDPFSFLQLDEISKKDTSTLSANLVLSSKSQRFIDKIIVKGYEKFPKSYLRHYLNIKKGQTFNLSDIKNKSSVINDLRFANQIKDPEVLFTKDSTILYVYIEKVKSNNFDGFLGFGTNTETNKIEFDGYLNLNLTNNLNYGESLKLLYKSDENEQKTFDINTTFPYMFRTPLGVDLNLNIFKRDSSFINVSQKAKLFYQLNPNNQVSLGINSIKSENLLNSNVTTITDFKSDYYTANYIHTRPQNYNILFPTNSLFDITLGLGNRNSEGEDERQTKVELNTFKIFNLNEKNSFYSRLNFAYLDSNTYLENELFRFGGINSIRGFEENSLTANLYTVLNTEYRYQLNNTLYVNSVIDAAYFEDNFNLIKEKLFGFGFGFGLLTNSGLFKLNYSVGKTENQKFKFSNSKLHISLSANF
ncbi:POTRA domain-containing protein [Gaetbulibacter jejuensis]|uniref:Membrane protein n=1 Tax=Gaetbulibacter jejuensis TaxID=584607 RepID=A0ABN1JVE2_9FLAO